MNSINSVRWKIWTGEVVTESKTLKLDLDQVSCNGFREN